MISGIVLAGGRASRLGGAKLDIRIDGRSLLERSIDAVQAVCDEVVVAGPELAGFAGRTAEAGRSIRFVEDREAFPGPLAALAGALTLSNGDRAIVVAGDMPFLVPAVLASMLERLDHASAIDAVVLEAPGAPKRQVLPLGVRVRTVADAAAAALADGDRSLVRLVDRLRSVEIPASEWQAVDPGARTLVDIDEPADVERWTAG